MKQFSGYVTHLIYRNEKNGYTVFEMLSDGEEITCIGYLPAVSEGESCLVTGEETIHPLYGEQLKITEYTVRAPEDSEALLRYLSSGAVKGIGAALAARILKAFGDDTGRILEEEPERLAEIKGISEAKARDIAAQLEGKQEIRAAMIYMQKFGISYRKSLQIWQRYGEEIYTVLKENPYRLADDIDGIGFEAADEIARRIGFAADSRFRIRCALLHILSRTLEEGSSYLPEPELVSRTGRLLTAGILPEDVPEGMEEEIRTQIRELSVLRELVLEDAETPGRTAGESAPLNVYQAAACYTERHIAARLSYLASFAPKKLPDECLRECGDAEDDREPDEMQQKAIRLAAENTIVLVSGGPGTGKTTLIRTLIRILEAGGQEVLLAAPTGRAAKRMSSLTGREAATIHRLLGVRPARFEEDGDEKGHVRFEPADFEKNESDPLEADAVIIDEMSMVDLFLFEALLDAVRPGTRLVLVGDQDQLPSVGPGSVLRDLLEADVFPQVILKKIFRQAEKSDIVMNAHRILAGEPLTLDNQSRDFFFLERSDPAVIQKHTAQLICDLLPGYVQCRPDEIQVLTPMRKGALGAVQMNLFLREVINPPSPGKREMTCRDTLFREGDKVMQIRNNYQLAWEVRDRFGIPVESGAGVFNGDFGQIEEVDPRSETLTVRFDEDRMVVYTASEWDDLDLAYAITVHKSQGSEYPAVILPILQGPPALFNRNLLYTAVTRARRAVVILGSSRSLSEMENNAVQRKRYTGLCRKLRDTGGSDLARPVRPLR